MSLKMDVGKQGEHDDSHDQVSRRLNSQAAGVETQDPVSRRTSSQVAGVETQDSVSRRTSSQVAGVETQDSVSRRHGSQVAGGGNPELSLWESQHCPASLLLGAAEFDYKQNGSFLQDKQWLHREASVKKFQQGH